MSEKQVARLFAMMRDLAEVVEKQAGQLEEMTKAVHSAVSNSELVLNGYQQHGTSIENLTRLIERLRIRCPLMKPITSELEKIG